MLTYKTSGSSTSPTEPSPPWRCSSSTGCTPNTACPGPTRRPSASSCSLLEGLVLGVGRRHAQERHGHQGGLHRRDPDLHDRPGGDLVRGSNTSFPSFLDTNTVRFLGVNIRVDEITVLIISVAATADPGITSSASCAWGWPCAAWSTIPSSSRTGTNPVGVRRAGPGSSALSSPPWPGFSIASLLNLDAYMIAWLVVSAFGVAAIGYFSNLSSCSPAACSSVRWMLVTKYAASISWLGWSAGWPFHHLGHCPDRHAPGRHRPNVTW